MHAEILLVGKENEISKNYIYLFFLYKLHNIWLIYFPTMFIEILLLMD